MTVKFFLIFLTVHVYYSLSYSVDLTCDREHEHYECGSPCQTTCATLGIGCPIGNKRCVQTCYCDQGYARNDYGTCVPEEQCLLTTTTERSRRKNSQNNKQRPKHSKFIVFVTKT
ncbi:hypothetical protein SFRURICE_008353 [Spodoptera frugiperda]|uniref:SFRICE_004253 n=1 Tax=Spodoptera frugiperda TaxID=7108 RepID=A0A2H1VNJ7_SPOFR|nr:hypothetical protein SFRURICE_008353 [Spodoptera frugiperda]